MTAALSGVGATILVAGCFVPYYTFNWRKSSSSSDSNSDKQTLAVFGGGYFFLYIFFAIVVFAFLALVLRRHKTDASRWAPCTACLMTSGAVLAISIGEKRTTFRRVREYSYSPRLGFWLILAAGLLLLACGILGIILATKATPKMIGVAYLRQSSDKSPSDFAGDPRAVGNVFAAEGARPQPSYGQNPQGPGNERTGPHIGSSPTGHSSGRPSSSFRPPYGSVN